MHSVSLEMKNSNFFGYFEKIESFQFYSKPIFFRHAEERNVLFASLDNTDRYYNAYEDDIAVAHFFFNSPTAFQFEKAVRYFHIFLSSW